MIHLAVTTYKLPSSRVSTLRRWISNVIVKSPYPFDQTKTPTNIPLGKFVFSKYEKNMNELKNEIIMFDGSTGYKLTAGEIYELTYRIAYVLIKDGIRAGFGVGIMAPNHIHYSPIILGTTFTGGHSTTINPLCSDDELFYQLDLADVKVMFVYPSYIKRVLPIAAKLKIKVVSMDMSDESTVSSFNDYLDNIKFSSIDVESLNNPKAFDTNSTAIMPFSSGTTGRSKGVMLSHRNLISNTLQYEAMEPHMLQRFINGKKNSMCIPLPFFHIFGMTTGMIGPMYSGCLSDHKIRRAYVVPPIVLALLKHPIVANYNLSSLEVLVCGAAPLSAELKRNCSNRLNCIIKSAWGLTETSPGASGTLDEDANSPASYKGACGKLFAGTEGKIVNPLTGVDMNPTEEGEILVRGPQVMNGYVKNPESTAATIRPDGWMHTGDIGHFDEEGFLFITDRSKELIKYKGFQVPPAELEAVLLTMPELKDAIVIPVKDDEAGEIPRAYVVKQDNCPDTLSEQDVADYVNAKVSPHKRLRGGVRFAKQIPKSAAGKLLRQVQIDRGEIAA